MTYHLDVLLRISVSETRHDKRVTLEFNANLKRNVVGKKTPPTDLIEVEGDQGVFGRV